MKRTLQLITLALACASPAGIVLAQQAPAPTTMPAQTKSHGDPQQQLQHMTKQLQLTADQQAKIGPLLQDRQQQIAATRADASLKPADRRAKIQSIMQGTQASVDGVLTDTQRQRWSSIREKAMQRHEETRQAAQDAAMQQAPASARSTH